MVVVALLLYLFLQQILNYFYFSLKYQPYTLESFSFYINIVSIFFVATTLYGAIMFLQYNRFVIAGIGLFIFGLSVYQILWVNKISWMKSNLFLFAIPLTLAELFIAISYLPTTYLVDGVVVAIFFYMMIGLTRLFLLEQLNKKNVAVQLAFGALALAVVLATASWI
jgi:hypothetical protein